MPMCLMMVGVPGSGKSTKIKETIKDFPHFKVVSSDEYLEKVAKEQGKTYDEVHADNIDAAIKWMNSQIQTFIKNKENFIWDQTNLVKSSREKKLRNLKSNGYEVNALTFELPEEEVFYRLEKRVAEGGKSISPKVIKNMMDSYERPSFDEGFDNIFLIDKNGNDVQLSKTNKLKP